MPDYRPFNEDFRSSPILKSKQVSSDLYVQGTRFLKDIVEAREAVRAKMNEAEREAFKLLGDNPWDWMPLRCDAWLTGSGFVGLDPEVLDRHKPR